MLGWITGKAIADIMTAKPSEKIKLLNSFLFGDIPIGEFL